MLVVDTIFPRVDKWRFNKRSQWGGTGLPDIVSLRILGHAITVIFKVIFCPLSHFFFIAERHETPGVAATRHPRHYSTRSFWGSLVWWVCTRQGLKPQIRQVQSLLSQSFHSRGTNRKQ